MEEKTMKLRRTKKIISVSLILALVCIAGAGCGGGGGGGGGGDDATVESITLRLASDAPMDHIATRLNEAACQKVEDRTDGRVKINYYGGSQLGSYESVYEELVRGTVDIAQISVPDALDSRLGAPYLPYYATSWEEAAILYSPDSYMSQVFAEITATQDVRFLGWVLEGFIGMGVVIDPTNVFEPGAPKGIKLRSPAMATFRIVQEDLGYNAIAITYAEVPMAIQTKVVDGWIGGTPNINYAWVGEIITKMYVNYLHAEATCYVMSEKTLAKLSDEDRATVIAVFQEQSVQSIIDAEANEQVYKEKLTEAGVEVVEFTAAQLKTNADFVRNVTWPKLEDVLTKELLDNFKAEVDKL